MGGREGFAYVRYGDKFRERDSMGGGYFRIKNKIKKRGIE